MNKDPNLILGIAFLAIGVGVTVALDPWFLGVPFLLLGGHRLYVAYRAASAARSPGLD